MPATILKEQAIQLPSGTTAQRPATPTDGMIRYNTSFARSEVYSTASGGWIGYGDTLGTQSNPAVSATSLFNAGITQNGYYWLKGNGSTAYNIYCDFTTAGGNWMLLTQFTQGYNASGLEGSSYFVYSDQPSNSGPTATDATVFWIPLNLFSQNGIGSDLDVYASVYKSGSWRRFGAYWRGIPHAYVLESLGDGGACATSSAGPVTIQVSGNGTSWTSTGSTTIYKCQGWNGPTWNAASSSTYSYQDSSLSTGGIIYHADVGDDKTMTKLYGAVDGIGLSDSDTAWSYGRVWVRSQG